MAFVHTKVLEVEAASMIAFDHYQRRISRGFPGLEYGVSARKAQEPGRILTGSCFRMKVQSWRLLIASMAAGTRGEGHNR